MPLKKYDPGVPKLCDFSYISMTNRPIPKKMPKNMDFQCFCHHLYLYQKSDLKIRNFAIFNPKMTKSALKA